MTEQVGLRAPGTVRIRRGVFAGTAVLLAAASVFASGGGALAADPVSQSTGQFLGGSLLSSVDLTSIVSLGGATATNTGGAEVTDNEPLQVDLLGAVNLNLGTVSLPLSNLLQLGLLNQYASASPDGSSYGASGALVSSSGAINTSPPTAGQSAATLDLGPVLPSSVTSTIGDLKLSVGAVAASATETAAKAQSGDEFLAGVTVNAMSPLVAGVSNTLTTTLNTALAAPIAAVNALGVVNGVPNVGDLVASLGDIESADGCLTANINTGVVAVDLDCIVQKDAGVSLADLPANYDLGIELTKEITNELPSALGNAINDLQQKLLAQVNAMTVSIPFVGTVALPTNLLTPLISAVTSTVSTVTAGLGATVVQPVSNVVSQVLDLTVNKQSTSDGTFTETALAVDVLPGLGGLGSLNLATATVGPNAGALPAAPTITGPANGSTTTDTTPTIIGTGAAGDTVTVTDAAGDQLCTATVAADGTWSCTPTTAMAVGTQTITATQTDAAGGVSPASAADSFTIEPAAPAITAPVDGSSADDTTPAITGTGTAGNTVTVTEGGTTLCTATVASDGTWSCMPATALALGDHTVSATQTDPASGLTSAASPDDTFTIVPAAPAITGPADGSTTTDATPTITGTGVPGDTVTVTDAAGDQVCTATVQPDGTWSCTPTNALPDGGDALTATQTDSASGTTSAASDPDTFTVEPAAPAITAPTDGSTTANTTPTITGTGTPGDTVTVTEGGTTLCTATVQANGSWSCTPATPLVEGDHTITATQSASDGTQGPASDPDTFTVSTVAAVPDPPAITSPSDGATITDPTPPISGTGTAGDTVTVTDNGAAVCTATVQSDGTWSCTPTDPLPEGANTLTATQADASGDTSVDSTPVDVTLTPATPTITTPAANAETPDSTPDIAGIGTPGDTVTVVEGGSTLCTATVAADGTWSCTPATPLSVGPHTISATQSDPAGDQSEAVTDGFTVLPPAPVIASPTTGTTTDDATPTITGTGDPGDTVTVSDGTTAVCTATVQDDGSWSCTPTTALPIGDNTLTATQQDANGDTSPASPVVVVTIAPEPPTITGPTTSSDDTTPAITGTGTPGDTVTVSEGGTTVCTTTVANDGSWSCTPTTPLSPGDHTLTATETDPATGTTSAASDPLTVTVLPTAPAITGPTGDTSDTTPTISGTGTPGDTVNVTEGTTTVCTTTVAADGSWSCTPATALAIGDHAITATQTDAAGGVSAASSPDDFAVVPTAPAITSPTQNGTTTSTTPTISGTGTPGDTVTVFEGTTQLCTATVAADGTWSCTPAAPLATGAHTIDAVQATPSGVSSGASTAVTFDVVPSAPTISSPPPGTTTDDPTPDISGTGTPGDTVTVSDGSTTVCTATVQSDGTWSCAPTADLPDGSNMLTATQSDGAENSAPSAPVQVIVVPTVPVISAPTSGDELTDSTPEITGTGVPGDSVTVYDGTTTVCTATVQSDGSWSCTPTTPLPDGDSTLSATQSDASGNTSAASDPVGITVLPTAPAITVPASGATVAGPTPVISGTGDPGDTITVTDGTATICTATVQSDGSWTCTPTAPLSDGTHTVTATQADAAGDTSAASDPVSFTVVPAAPVITGPTDGSSTGDTTPVLSGTGAPGDTVTVTDGDGNTVCTATVQQDGSWSCTPRDPLPDGSTTLTATQTDPSGLTSSASDPVTFVVASGVCTAAPSSISIVPSRGPVAGGTATVITGTEYEGVQKVEFGDEDAASFTVVDSSHIDATSPAHPVGTVEIKITTPCGVDPIYFTYYDASGAVAASGGSGAGLLGALAGTGQDLSRVGMIAGLAALVAGAGTLVVAARRRGRKG